MLRIVHYTGDGSDHNVELGFIPDYCILFELADSNPNIIHWCHPMKDDATGKREGLKETGSGGDVSYNSNDQGISEWDDDTSYVNILHPGSGKKVKVSVADWATGTSYASGQRSATAIGTIVRPPVHNGRVFELTTQGGNGGTAPTSWDVQPGETVADTNNTWTCREEEVVKGGGKGITVRGEINTDSKQVYVIAMKADMGVVDLGNADDFLS